MRRFRHIILLIFLTALFPLALDAQENISVQKTAEPVDSLDRMLNTYLQALEYESLQTQQDECDFLIGTCSDPEVRREVALKIYDHYLHSPLMGVEAVAIHVFDRWFDSGRIAVPEDMMFGARIFAEFNRSSLIGMKAPDLQMCGPDGDSVSVFSDGNPSRRYKLLYFYDTDCPKCFIETARMPYLIKEDFPLDFYPIYVGVDGESWKSYRKKFVPDSLELSNTVITDLWDPEVTSDYQRKYGVLQTPRLFLVDNMGVIRGRGLDVPTAMAMLHEIFDEKVLEYGSERSVEVFDQTFEPYGEKVREEDVRFVADYISRSTVEVADTLMYKQLMGDMLYYLIPKKGQGWKAGLEYVIDHHILSRNDVWKTADDSLKVVGTAQMMSELLGLAAEGSRLPALKVPGKLFRAGALPREGKFNLRKLGGRRNLILFWTEGCEYCRAEKEAADRLLAGPDRKGVRILEVDMDEALSSSTELADALLTSFDLTALPFIVETDRRGRVTGKYISLVQEKQ